MGAGRQCGLRRRGSRSGPSLGRRPAHKPECTVPNTSSYGLQTATRPFTTVGTAAVLAAVSWVMAETVAELAGLPHRAGPETLDSDF
jgi:hypothetical protein